MTAQLNEGYCDIVMSGVIVSPEWAQGGAFSAPYMDLTGTFIVKDHRREEFSSRAALRRLQAPGIGLLNSPYYIDLVHRYLPQATLVPLNSITEFFEGRGEELDAFLSSA
jgi:ABC-type amino acid transport substrate-binding protein